MRLACAICGQTNKDGVELYRVSVIGDDGVFACPAHGIQAIQNLARARGVEAVLPENRRFIKRDLRLADEACDA